MATPSVDHVLSRLDEVVDRAHDERDRSGYFALLYRLVTAKVKEGLDAGFFDDAVRMERLDVLFAERYLDAVAAVRQGQAATASWQLAFAAAGRWRPVVLQHLLVGVNAHINLDLGIAAARCVPAERLPELQRDYDRINAILAAMVDVLQPRLRELSPWLAVLDLVGARTQTELVRFSIVTARAGAWRFAVRLAATPQDRWPATIEQRDGRVAKVGRMVLQPGPLKTAALLVARLRERDDVRANLDHLAAVEPPSFATIAARAERLSTT